MGCVPSKGEVLMAPAKSEYQHALPANGKDGKPAPETARKKGSKSEAAPSAVTENADTAKNAKKPSNGWIDGGPGELTGGFSTDVNRTEVTDAHEPDLIGQHPPVAQLDTANLDATAPLEASQALPLNSDEEATRTEKNEHPPLNQNRRYFVDDLSAIPTSQHHLAATLIQSVYRGRLIRRGFRPKNRVDPVSDMSSDTAQKSATAGNNDKNAAGTTPKQAEEEIDIDLKDPEVEKAAIKIQGAFKGLKMKRNSSSSGAEQTPG
ncbi:hypothetical protein BV898_02505 [Hypsibius exemplaris]|uniref:Uncharacterized protein n=1 Tax=Hypsibius exemplaris TaxID=2072580 RepID=A0A1W0X8B5_HYPEX|nr:hypothetical protein BV898_02505 [Hypsibius exemplaris]